MYKLNNFSTMDFGLSFVDISVKSITAGLCLGYFLGFLLNRKSTETSESKNNRLTKEVPNVIQPTYTVALVVNSSLKMGKGKIAAQCGHAILSLIKKATKKSKSSVDKWVEEGKDMILVSVKTTDDFNNLAQMATMESLEHYIVADAGRTQIQSGSLTVMAIGPGHRDVINSVIGQLPLYL